MGISVLSLAEILYWMMRAFTGTAFMVLINAQALVKPNTWKLYPLSWFLSMLSAQVLTTPNMWKLCLIWGQIAKL